MANEIAKAEQVFGFKITRSGGMPAGSRGVGVFMFTAATFAATSDTTRIGLGGITWDASGNEVAVIGAVGTNEIQGSVGHKGSIILDSIQVWSTAAVTAGTQCSIKLLRRVGSPSMYDYALSTGTSGTAVLFDGLDQSTNSTAYYIENLTGDLDLQSAAVTLNTTNAVKKNLDIVMLPGDMLALDTGAVTGAASKKVFIQVAYTRVVPDAVFGGVGIKAW